MASLKAPAAAVALPRSLNSFSSSYRSSENPVYDLLDFMPKIFNLSFLADLAI